MENKIENKIELQDQSVQSTMLLAVYGRAKASKSFPDVLRDDEAIRIVDGMDYDFAQIDKTYGKEYSCLCCLLRAKRLDERCAAYIKSRPNCAVVNLGAGLDTTFSRVDNGSIRWYNVDLPDSLAFRNKFIPNGTRFKNADDASDSSAFRNKIIPNDTRSTNADDAPDSSAFRNKFVNRSERSFDIAKSMFDYTWLDEIPAADGVFIIAGGLFYYFKEEQIRALIAKIAERFPQGEIFFDAQSKTAVKISNRMVRKTGNKGSEMYFFVNEPEKLKDWSPKIREVESVQFFGDLWKDKRFKLSTRISMLTFDKLKMGYIIGIKWNEK